VNKGFSPTTKALCSQQANRQVGKAAFDAGRLGTVYKAGCFARAPLMLLWGQSKARHFLLNRSRGEISPHNILGPVQQTFYVPDLQTSEALSSLL